MTHRKNHHNKRMPPGRAFLVMALILLTGIAAAQYQNKQGGIAFRVDNNPPLARLNTLDSLFVLHSMPFGMAITSWTLPISPDYVAALKSFIAHGHEVMDNTPTHQTNYFKVLDISDTALFSGKPGVDHIVGEKICLRYVTVDTSQPHNEWKINLFDNKVISYNPGEFSDLMLSSDFFALYLSEPVNQLCVFYNVQAYNVNDPDTLYVRSFWDEPLAMGNHWYFSYHKLTHRNVVLHPSAIQLLGERSLALFDSLGIEPPVTWIHPAGPYPYVSGYELSAYMGDSLGYQQGSNYVNYTYRCYNEYDPYGIAPFGMQSSLTSIENQPFSSYKHIASSAIARHFINFDVATLLNPYGGWSAFVARLDSLLFWCQSKGIPVLNYADWKVMLYDSLPERVAETFPPLNVDLDDDLLPDGYDTTGIEGYFDPSDGVWSSGYKSWAITGSGTVCKVLTLGGLEKGKNKFSLSTKLIGADSAMVSVIFSYPGSALTDTLLFSAYSGYWTSFFDLTEIPAGVSVMNAEIQYTTADTVPDTLKVSGMSLRSAGFLKKTQLPDQIHHANEPFANIDLDALVDPTIYPPSVITWEVKYNHWLNITIEEENILQVMKPASFWTGEDSSYVVGTAPDGLTDSCLMRFESLPLDEWCAGQPVTLTLLDTLSNDIIRWSSEPLDSSFTDTTIYNPTVAPLVSTLYRVRVINPLGPINKDSIMIYVYPYPDPDLPSDTVLCSGDTLLLTAQGEGSFLWSTGDTTSSILVRPDNDTVYSVTVTTDHNCSASDTTVVLVRQKPGVRLYGLWPSYCSDGYSSTLIGQPSGGTFGATSGLVEENVFDPREADTGLNLVWYSYTDTLTTCANADTVRVMIVPLPDPLPLPDTTICADEYILLHAGPGFDNYLWSTGSTDSVVLFDTTGRSLGTYEIRVYVTKNGCAGIDTANITFINCHPGIWEPAESMIRVYPNPAGDRVFAELSVPGKWEANILDATGNSLVYTKGTGRTIVLDLGKVSAGIYFLQVRTEAGLVTVKLIRL